MDDLLDSIEKGKFDIPGFLTTDLPIWVLILSVMNRTYLKHIINELYPNEIERKQIIVKLYRRGNRNRDK